MPHSTLVRAILGAIVALGLPLAPEVRAQNILYVSTSGDDGLNCASPELACEHLQAAHDQTANPGVKIVVLDSGNFGPVTITKSVAISAVGVDARIPGTANPIVIDAGPNDVIDIDGLAMSHFPFLDSTGIDFINGGKLQVRNCTIRSFGIAGIHIRGGGSKRVVISDCIIANNVHGVWARRGSNVFLERVTVDGNTGNGVRAQGSRARVHISNSMVVNNDKGLNALNGGRILSFGNNVLRSNRKNGAPTATVDLR